MGSNDLLRYAQLAHYSYHNTIDPDDLKTDTSPTMEVKRYLDESNAQCYVYQDKNELIICFRGSDSVGDAITNVNFIPVEFYIKGQHCGRVHGGYLDYYKRLRNQLMSILKEHIKEYGSTSRLSFVGHSLGGCVVLCALEASYVFSDIQDMSVYTFGAPSVGNKDFRDTVHKQIKSITRVVYENDIVPHLPLNLINVHIAEEPIHIKHTVQDRFAITKCVEHHNMDNYIQALKRHAHNNIPLPQPKSKRSSYFWSASRAPFLQF